MLERGGRHTDDDTAGGAREVGEEWLVPQDLRTTTTSTHRLGLGFEGTPWSSSPRTHRLS